MAIRRGGGSEIRKFIIDNIESHPGDIARLVVDRFKVTRQAAGLHLKALVAQGILEATGKTRLRTYSLKRDAFVQRVPLAEFRDEDLVWRTWIAPRFEGISDNVQRICQYGFTEIFNNALDHSEGQEAVVEVWRTAKRIRLAVGDDGVGIFEKIKNRFDLADHRQAIFALVKGKLTTDPVHHTGQGIFFSSRMFDEFSIFSEDLGFLHRTGQDDWLIEDAQERTAGTYVSMVIANDSTRTPKDVFDHYTDLESGNYEFSKTRVPLLLAKYGRDSLVSRSQARRVLEGLDQFQEVFLDFTGVDFIGQAFADEIFRVYAIRHPEVQIIFTNTTEDVRNMIVRAIRARYQQ